ncbi:MAG: IMPACT family protein [Bacillota bacterium]
MLTEFRTVARASRVKIPVGLCRFISSVEPASSEDEARAFISRVSREFADATHNVWAYRIGTGTQAIFRYSDDGEPAQTAGPPTLAAIDHRDLTDVVVVGTRYFGGVKLGVGGLIRAYRQCADAGLAEAGCITKVITMPVVIRCGYDHLGTIMNELESLKGKIERIDYDVHVTVTARVRPVDLPQLEGRVTDITRGTGMVLRQPARSSPQPDEE